MNKKEFCSRGAKKRKREGERKFVRRMIKHSKEQSRKVNYSADPKMNMYILVY